MSNDDILYRLVILYLLNIFLWSRIVLFFLFSVGDKFCRNLFPIFCALNLLSFNSWICWKITKLFLAIKSTVWSQKWWDSCNPVHPLYLWTAKGNNCQKPRAILARKWLCALLTWPGIFESRWLNTAEQIGERRSRRARTASRLRIIRTALRKKPFEIKIRTYLSSF